MEEWRSIPGFDGYEASSYGRIRSVDRIVPIRNGRTRFVRGRILSPGIHSKRYPYRYVNLQRGKPNIGVHRLVCLAFHGLPATDTMMACHRDGDCANNNADNLYWGTPKQNQLDRKRHGTASIGDRHGMSKLTSSVVETIRHRLSLGEKQLDLAKEFGVSQPAISHIATQKRWNL